MRAKQYSTARLARPRISRRAASSPSIVTSSSAAIYIPTQEADTGRTRKPAARRLGRLRKAIIPLLLLLVCLGLARWLFTGSTWQVRSVRLEGTNDPMVQAAIDTLDLPGQNIFSSDLGAAGHRLSALPVVATAQAYRVYPDGVLFRVTLRIPALRWRTRTQTLVLASDGTVLGSPDAAHASWSQLPVVEDQTASLFSGKAARAGQHVPREIVEMAVQLLKGLSKDAGTQLSYSAGNAGQGFRATAPGGQRIVFGTPTDAAALFRGMRPQSASAASGDDAARGVAVQLRELSRLRALLMRQRIDATLIDLRWWPYPYYRTD